MKILIPVDGSTNALRAVDYVLKHCSDYAETPELMLLNVQWNVATANVKMFIKQDVIDNYYREQGLAALKGAMDKLDATSLPYHYHISIGTPAEAIVQYANEQQVDKIVMGRQGEGGLQALLLGSVVHKVLHLANCPVMLIK